MSTTHPFAGLLVADFTHVLAGPACSYYLGLLGADVIGVPSARLRSLSEAISSDQIRQRGYVQTTDDSIDVPTLPFRLGGAHGYKPSRPAPAQGEHNEEIIVWLTA